MTTYVLYGVKAKSLDQARDLVEKTLQVTLEAREGLHNGGDYYSLPFPARDLKLRNNIDLDDDEMEFDGLSEPDFPKHLFLLYLNDADKNSHMLTALEGARDVFEKLRTEVA